MMCLPVDYLPETYRKYCLFQVKSMEHSIDTTGWDTNISRTNES